MVVAPNLLQLYGSVIPRALPWAVIGCTLGVVVKWANNNFDGIVFTRRFAINALPVPTLASGS